MESESGTYIGRFAPSPSGPLHFGSLVAAVASYLDARANHGIWLVRMEDLDPAREPQGAASEILHQLEDFGMHSDQPVLFQSTRLDAYQRALDELTENNLTYFCDCSRQQVKAMGSIYNGACRDRTVSSSENFAVRIKTKDQQIEFADAVQGLQLQNILQDTGDFVIKRKDGLFAYQLAVVVDDAFQKISHVVRGVDLLDSTARQIYLQQQLNLKTPEYSHIPIVVNPLGQKLSKQHFADPIDPLDRQNLLHTAIKFLGMRPPESNSKLSVDQQLQWGISHWDIQNVPKLANIPHHTDFT